MQNPIDTLCGKCYHIFLPFLSLNSHTENIFLYELHFKWTRKLAQLNDPIKEMKLKRNTTYQTNRPLKNSALMFSLTRC